MTKPTQDQADRSALRPPNGPDIWGSLSSWISTEVVGAHDLAPGDPTGLALVIGVHVLVWGVKRCYSSPLAVRNRQRILRGARQWLARAIRNLPDCRRHAARLAGKFPRPKFHESGVRDGSGGPHDRSN